MLIIRQEGKGQPYRFRVERVGAGGVKSAPAVELNSPLERRLEGTQLTLGAELQWYLEDYFCYPFPPITERADRVRG